jgi:hypothetical protein
MRLARSRTYGLPAGRVLNCSNLFPGPPPRADLDLAISGDLTAVSSRPEPERRAAESWVRRLPVVPKAHCENQSRRFFLSAKPSYLRRPAQ